MALKVLIVPDKFKGTLTARGSAAAIAEGWRRARPEDPLKLLPICDGGDGFGEVMGGLCNGKVRRVRTVDAAHRVCAAQWWWDARSGTAIIESAQAIGLAQLPPGKFHPFDLDTFGLGKVIKAAAKQRARTCLIGIGGSATNDGGFGTARALGWKFRAADGSMIERWTDLERLEEIIAPPHRVRFERAVVAVDVKNPLLGKRGATRIFGPQKGLRPRDFKRAEECLRRLAVVTKRQFGRNLAVEPGAGAAGGLGFGLRAFLGAKFEPGFEMLAKRIGLDGQLDWADLVITGEGAVDGSTLMGKGAGEVGRRCREAGTPCLALAGVITENARRGRLFHKTRALTDLTTIANAKADPRRWLKLLAERTAREVTAENL